MTSRKVIFDAAQMHISNFIEEFYEPNMLWLLEVQQEAIRIFNSPAVLLPRTPSTKRKFVNVDKANACEAKNYESTFHEGAENKKLKIDDLSTIIDTSVIDNSNLSANNTLRSLRPRRTKKTSQPLKRSKRVAAKKNHQQNNVKSIVISQDFIPPTKIDNISFHTTNNNSILKINSPGNITSLATQVQPKVSALIESLKMTPHYTSSPPNAKDKNGGKGANGGKLYKNIQVKIDFEDSPCKSTTDTLLDTDVAMQNETNSTTQQILTKNTLLNDSIDVIDHPSSKHAACAPESVNDTIEPVGRVNHVLESTPEVVGRTERKLIESIPLDTSCIPMETAVKVAKIEVVDESPGEDIAPVAKKDISPSSEKSQKKLKLSIDKEKEENTCVDEDVGRRDTYKIITNNIIDASYKKPSPNVDALPIYNIMKADTCGSGDTNKTKDVKKPPKIVKHIKPGGNVVSNIKSFLKQPGSPRMETGSVRGGGGNVVTNIKTFLRRPDSPKVLDSENQAAKKVAEFEKKDLLRQKAIEEVQKKKQKQVEERKKLHEERKKRFAEQQQRILEEEEVKRKQLKIRAEQIAKNQEEIRKVREQEEKRKRELRDMKKTELDARRQKEEEEHKRKAAEQMREEKRKQEIIQRKYELDEQKRLEQIAEKDMLGKDKLRQVEECRMFDEERKKREFEEKENHRLDVERKKKESKEKERLERQAREEMNKQAEKDIIEAKKHEEGRVKAREEERQRAKDKLREEIKEKFKNDYINKVINVPEVLRSKVINVPDVLRSSPRLKMKYNPPVVPLVERDSIFTSYGIDDLNSDDSTDDESEPAKRIPSWAMGSRLKKQLMRQFYTNIEPNDIFVNCMEPLFLDKIFNKNKTRYFKRTSSAQWGSPPLKGVYKYRK